MKEGSIPSLFPNCPSYLSKEENESRTEAATSSKRFERENERNERQIKQFLSADSVESLDEIEKRLASENVPAGISVLNKQEKLCLSAIDFSSPQGPTVNFALVI